MRFVFLISFLSSSIILHAQVMTLIATHQNGLRDTVRFGFLQNATLDEDIPLGEENIFMAPVNGYEGRILQRDSSNFSCAMLLDNSEIYYTNNFDSKTNYRNIQDTTLLNRFFEIWYSDNQTDSMEMICDIPLRSFLQGAYIYPLDCNGIYPSPVGLLVIQNDTIKHLKYQLQHGLGIKQHIFITNPDLVITGVEEQNRSHIDHEIMVYPNPAFDRVYYQQSNQKEIKEIVIYDPVGRVIERFKDKPAGLAIDLNGYAGGTYMLLFVLENGEQIVKIVLKQ